MIMVDDHADAADAAEHDDCTDDGGDGDDHAHGSDDDGTVVGDAAGGDDVSTQPHHLCTQVASSCTYIPP